MAGAQIVDLTPPPDTLPRGGFSISSTTGQGFRSKIYARIYMLTDQNGQSHMFIQTDLIAGSQILQNALSESLASTTSLDASRITILATHNHSGPSQIFGNRFYNKYMSHQYGFGEKYFNFIVEKLSQGAQKAYDNQAPAKIAIGTKKIWGATRNRNLESHLKNKEYENQDTSDLPSVFNAINPSIYMVRIDTLQNNRYQPLGAFGSFSIHGTSLPAKEILFNSDIWAYIHQDWETFIVKKYHTKGQRPIVSLFQGTGGDIAPALPPGQMNYAQAKKLSKKITTPTIELYESLKNKLTSRVNIKSAAIYAYLQKNHPNTKLCDFPSVGYGVIGGANEHRVFPYKHLSFMNQKISENPNDCQGTKRHVPLFYGIQKLIIPKKIFPDFMIFQIIKINDMLIVPLPFELTVQSGRRLEKDLFTLNQKGNHGINHIMISNVANGYTGYVTTPEEYHDQHYEAGHTLYGKYSLPYLRYHLKNVYSNMMKNSSRVVNLPDEITYHLNIKNFIPEDHEQKISHIERKELAKPTFHYEKISSTPYWEFQWKDVGIHHINVHRNLIKIETKLKSEKKWQPLMVDHTLINDRHYDMEIRLKKHLKNKEMAIYRARWYEPQLNAHPHRQYRFVIEPRSHSPALYSSTFSRNTIWK